MSTTFRYLPADVQQLSPADKLQRLRVLDPDKAYAIVLLLDAALNDEFRKQFHAGTRGGLRHGAGVH